MGALFILLVLLLVAVDSDSEGLRRLKIRPHLFSNWRTYVAWRHNNTDMNTNIMPCVRIPSGIDCLPSLIIIGAFKGGSTGVRHKLLASKRFHTYGTSEDHFWDTPQTFQQAHHKIAEFYAHKVGHFPGVPFSHIHDYSTGLAKVIVFDDQPRYIDVLSINHLKLVFKIVPHAQLLLLARSGSDIYFSGMEMNLCTFTNCASPEYPIPLDSSCDVALKHVITEAKLILGEGILRVNDIRNNPDTEINVLNRFGAYGAKGGYAFPLELIFFEVWPRNQITIVESERLWSHPTEEYSRICEEAGVPFKIKLVDGTRTRPNVQDPEACKCKNTSFVKPTVDRCGLKKPMMCVWYSANIRFAKLINQSWPLLWNQHNGMTISSCFAYGFSEVDLSFGLPEM